MNLKWLKVKGLQLVILDNKVLQVYLSFTKNH